MPRTYPEFEQAVATRQKTLEMIQGLSQEQVDFRPGRGKWSVGEVLDHLLKTDAVISRELEVVFSQRRRGLPFVYRGIADIDTSVPFVLKPVLPFFEIPFGLANAMVPAQVRRFLTGNRRLPAQAPRILRPSYGRPVEDLSAELRRTFDLLRRQQEENPRFDFNRVYYYNPIVGLSSVPNIYKFISNHENRHQQQLGDILRAASFPLAA